LELVFIPRYRVDRLEELNWFHVSKG